MRITKERMMFAKGYEQIFYTEIFIIVRVIQPEPQPVYELSGLYICPIEDQYYNYEIVNFTVSPTTEFQIHKMRTCNKNGNKRHLDKCRGLDVQLLGKRYRYQESALGQFRESIPSDGTGYYFHPTQ